MRAWRIHELGHHKDALTLEDVPEPVPGPDQARIKVEAVNVNFADILLCQGVYQDRPGVPFTPGLEAVGVVEEIGEKTAADDLRVGDRVAAMCALPAGGYAEKALIRTDGAVVLDDEIPAVDATVLYTTYQTSHVALHHRARIETGEWLLVHAAAGGVGSAAVQLGLAAGATVIATAGGAAKTAACREHGAQHVIDYRTADLYKDVMELTGGRGVDVAFDPVGGATGDLTRRLMAWEGRLVVIGFAAGDIPMYPANHILVKNYSVLGLHWAAYAQNGGRHVVETAHRDLLSLYRAETIKPHVHRTVALDEVPQALDDLEGRQIIGRYVVTVGG